ncbi:MAG: hypothetical protein BHW00_06520 [Clostridium sp. 26_22]|nr:MAG: hypothetical protein BHW00_06520 [Clostridium sp. 26_22]
MENEPIRILNIVPNMRAAGIETFIMNIYRNIDRKKVQFDFLVHNEKEEFYDKEINDLGGRIYRLTYKDDKNIFKYIKDLNDFFKGHKEYKIVHGHMQSMMPIYLYIAKKNKVSIRIAHSHNNSYEKSIKGFLLHILSRFSRLFANVKFACSKDAGVYLFGKNKKFEVINNGINIEKFVYNLDFREKIRNNLGLTENEILIGNVGRMEKQKNQLFLIDCFKELTKLKNNYKLLIIGEGSLNDKIIKRIKKHNIQDKVLLLKNVKNVNEYMQAMDIFALPSLYEGLGIVLIEAQMSGLKCFTTKDKVAKETNITDNIYYLPLEKKVWVNNLSKIEKYDRNRKIELLGKKFDINCIAKSLQDKYLKYNEIGEN